MGNSLSGWIEILFNLKLSKHPTLKNTLNSYIRNETIKMYSEGGSGTTNSRGKRYINADQKVKIHNVVVLDAFFGDTKFVKSLFETQAAKERAVDILNLLFHSRSSVADVSFSSTKVDELIDCLTTSCDLNTTQLPNPFEQNKLPQILLPELASLSTLSLGKVAAEESTNSYLNAYLDGNIELAYKTMPSDPTSVSAKKLNKLIQSRYIELAEFEKTLDLFK